MDQGAAGGLGQPVKQQGGGGVALSFGEPAQVVREVVQALTFAGQWLQRACVAGVQPGQQGAHLSAAIRIHSKIVLAGQSGHQHRGFAGHGNLVLAVGIRQRRGDRQVLFRQMFQQGQVRRQGRRVQGFEHGEYQRAGLTMAITGLDQEGAVLDAVAGGVIITQLETERRQHVCQLGVAERGVHRHHNPLA